MIANFSYLVVTHLLYFQSLKRHTHNNVQLVSSKVFPLLSCAEAIQTEPTHSVIAEGATRPLDRQDNGEVLEVWSLIRSVICATEDRKSIELFTQEILV